LGGVAVLVIVALIGVIAALLMSDDGGDDKAAAVKKAPPTTVPVATTVTALAPRAGQAATPTTSRPSTSAAIDPVVEPVLRPTTITTAAPAATAPPTNAPRFTSASATPSADFSCDTGDTVHLSVAWTTVNATRVNAAGFGGGTQDSGPSGSYGATMPCASSINQITITLTAYGPEGSTVKRFSWHVTIFGGTK
jgi:hypothetical protein